MNHKDNDPRHELLIKNRLLPQEEKLEVGRKKEQLIIGIPRESEKYENRVALTPEAVELLVSNGHQILVEHNAGIEANYTDNDYSENGALIIQNTKDVYQADIILKVAPLNMDEIELLRDNQTIFTSFYFSQNTAEHIQRLLQKKVTAIGSESIKDNHNCFPILQTMSEIAGTTSILVAAEYLSNVNKGKGVMLGGITGITPTEVVILGADTAGEFAARAALGLGAFVKVMDSSTHRLRELQNLVGQRLHTSILQPNMIEKALRSADVVIGALHRSDRGPRYVVTEEMVKQMKKGSVIIDISIDQGGCIETSECRTHGNPVYTKYGIVHYCVPNIPSRVARTASIALSNVFAPLMLSIGETGGIRHQLKEDPGLRNGVYIYNGILTNQFIGDQFGIPYKDIDLLMAAF
jgi:alanine dehydrogenase